MSGRAQDFDQWHSKASSLAEVLMRDHGCLLHDGPNPDHRACRACHRRVVLIRDWLHEHGVPDAVLAALPFEPPRRASPHACPECRNGKHVNCTGWALDEATDDVVTCGCGEAGHRVSPAVSP